MASYAEYFAKRDADKPEPKYNYGDRVFGFWNKVPFAGSVIREAEKVVLVQTDLPLRYNEANYNILSVAQKDVKLLKIYD